MAVPCNAGSVIGHYCPSQSRTQLYSGARTDALDPNEGARHQKEIRGINGRVRSAPARPNAGTEKSIIRFENRNAVLYSADSLDHTAACVLPPLGEINKIRV